jgi:hypothetical protein
MLVDDLRANASASNAKAIRLAAPTVKEAIVKRVRDVAPGELEATEKQIDQIIDSWLRRIEESPSLVYSDYRHPEQALLVDAARDDIAGEGIFQTLWSLRDVDRSSGLFEVRP